MGQNRDRSLDADGQPANYEPADPSLRSYHRGVWQLSLDGGVVGHIASVVGEIRFPYRAPWLWFLVIWIDGRRECPFEDYGPAWYTLRDIDAGYLEYHLPSATVERPFLWWRMSAGQQGAPQKYDVEKLPSGLAARRWEELALQGDQF